MSSNRLIYDTCAYTKSIQESTSPLNYTIYPGKYENCAKCRIEFGTVGGNGVSLFSGNLVDLESDLRGQTRPVSLCPLNKYQPECNNSGKDGIPCGSFGRNKQNLVNQPACQLQNYQRIPQPTNDQLYRCNYTNNS